MQAERVERVDYFHIELDTHDVIVAEGALSETFVDDDSRGMFHNAQEYDMLYATDASAPARYCAPRRNEGYTVEQVRRQLALQAGLPGATGPASPQVGALRGYIDVVGETCIAGWAQNSSFPEAPVCLDILADGKLIGQALANRYRDDLECAGLGSGRHGFMFDPPAGANIRPETIDVRRSLDGAPLTMMGSAKSNRLSSAA